MIFEGNRRAISHYWVGDPVSIDMSPDQEHRLEENFRGRASGPRGKGVAGTRAVGRRANEALYAADDLQLQGWFFTSMTSKLWGL
jgi:hypothetical protein